MSERSRKRIVEFPGGNVDFSSGCVVMGALNVTPDSFSDGGEYFDTDKAVERGIRMVKQGAAIVDVGPESTRPGARPVAAAEQIVRVREVVEKLSQAVEVPISIDTRNYEVAKACLQAGAGIINDVTALADERMGELAAKHGAGVILMHMQGEPQTMQAKPRYDDVAGEVFSYLIARAGKANELGISTERIFIDPGIGFGKTTEHNLQLLREMGSFVSGSWPVVVGTSRKGFIGKITGRKIARERIFGTAATVAACVLAGVSVVRVHDVQEMVEVVRMANAIRRTPIAD